MRFQFGQNTALFTTALRHLTDTGGLFPNVGGFLKKIRKAKPCPPKIKDSPFGPKISDIVPKNGVPKNWNKDQISDAIADYKASIASRKAELAAFDQVGGGNATQRLAHARRITEEENFLESLLKAEKDRK